jgi:4-hydroxybenzoate polyprenyltransferase
VREVLDMEVDRHTEFRTTACWLGRRTTLLLSIALFAASTLYLGVLTYILSEVPRGLVVPAFAVFPAQAWAFGKGLREGFDRDSLVEYIKHYRLLYGIAGLFMVWLLLA